MSAETIGDLAFTGKTAGYGGITGVPLTPDVIRDPELPKINKYAAPKFYAPRQSDLQRASVDPRSTSHGYLQRYGYAKAF